MSEILAYLFGSAGEFFLFVILAHKALDGTHCRNVFFNGLVELVILAEYASECGHCFARNKKKSDSEERYNDNEHRGKTAAHDIRHNDREDQHERAADRHSDDYHESHLHVSDVCGHSRHERRGRKPVDVGKRILFNAFVHIMTQISCKSRACLGGCYRSESAAEQ